METRGFLRRVSFRRTEINRRWPWVSALLMELVDGHRAELEREFEESKS